MSDLVDSADQRSSCSWSSWSALVVVHEFGHFVDGAPGRRPGPRVRHRLPAAGPDPRTRAARRSTRSTGCRSAASSGWKARTATIGRSARVRRQAACDTQLIILLAGVAMNLLLAFVIFFVIAWLADPVDIRVDGLVQPRPAAGRAGRRPGWRRRSAARPTRRSTTTRATSSWPSTGSSSPSSMPARPASPTP